MSIKLDHQKNEISTENNVITIASNSAIILPTGSTLQRAALPTKGMTRINNDGPIAKMEYFDGTQWEIVVSNNTGTLDDLVPYVLATQTM